MRRHSYLLTFLFFLVGLLAKPVMSEPLYWSAVKEDKELLIFGSVHVGNEGMYPLPKPVLDFLKTSDGLIVEADIRQDGNVQYPQPKVQSEQLLSSGQKQQILEIAKSLNLNPHVLLKSPPWATALTIQMKQFESLGYKSQYGVDSFLMAQAEQNHIPVLGLESLQFQINLLTQLPNDGKDLLLSGLDEWDDTPNMTNCMIESWKKGDTENLADLGITSEISPEINERFVYSRNHKWVELLDGNQLISEKSKHLIVVGTLHLVGEQNLLALLKQQGFSVAQLSKSEAASCTF
ncbi:TraB/GumN family protein [Vibrio sp. T187]|uniref:TraB/GumN family protein n=1 Tax=Vibrio TaxID=662 RepID=UPI0010CA1766|nr:MULTISPECIES: TraB/GumN family protein [Vibrio]MBW3696305.1 TraB/GumN family protein [Vibrio sp. T187]